MRARSSRNPGNVADRCSAAVRTICLGVCAQGVGRVGQKNNDIGAKSTPTSARNSPLASGSTVQAMTMCPSTRASRLSRVRPSRARLSRRAPERLHAYQAAVARGRLGERAVERDQPNVKPACEREICGVVGREVEAELPDCSGQLAKRVGQRAQL
jgi:hypothetical protein